MNDKEKVLLTGASGFIGGALARRLAQVGFHVICLMRPARAASYDLKNINGIDVITVSSFDRRTLEKTLDCISADVVFNLASYGVKRSERNPLMMIEGNISLLSVLMQVTSEWPLKIFVHAGSCSEYAPPGANAALRESDPLRPQSLYGAAKAASFIFGNALADGLGIPLVTLRLFGVYGLGEDPDRLVPYIIGKLRSGEKVDLTAGEQVRDLLYIEDVIDAFQAALEIPDVRQSDVYNICSGRPVRIRDIAVSVARAMNQPEKMLLLGKRPYRQDEPMWLVGDNRLFKSVTGWKPTIDLQEGIGRMVAALDGRC